ncbi:MAG: hypothetical protein IT323_06300 [Anaerolineae bacterium]|nr:hypothetical protein [Anaerolineae bacterium]
MEPWQRVWIDADTFPQDIHSQINCTACHAGQLSDDMETAHTGLVARPAANAETTCGKCHTDVTPASMNSLHTTLHGYDTVLYERSAPEHYAAIEEAETYHCNSCHTTCGDCHISQPASVGGGLLSGHTFVERPPMSQTCTACHGSRVKNEYYGLNEGIPGDVHFRARMSCVDCHTGDEVHGVGMTPDHRYDGAQGPSCESCHVEQIGVGSGVREHEVHPPTVLACQVCHSTTYTNCVNCHVEKNEEGAPFYTVEEHSLEFLIGRNPIQNAQRPYRYVPVRHVPIDIDSFSFYGADLLPNFDSRPTWTYSTPHNTQLRAPQADHCTACHGNDAVFLTADKVAPEELAANAPVIVETAPPLPEGYADEPTITPTAGADGGADGSAGGDDSFWGEGGSSGASGAAGTATPASGGDDGFWGSEGGSSGAAATATPASSDDSFWGGGESPAPTATPSGDDSFWGQ